MKPGRDIAVLAVLFGLVALAGVFLWGGQRSGMQEEILPNRSSYSSRPGGTKALYLTLDELGYRLRRQRQDLSHLPDGGILFLVEPRLPVDEGEWQGLKAWVEEGNFLCAFLEWGLPASTAEWVGPEDPLSAPAESDSTAIQPSFLAKGGQALRVRSRVRLSVVEEVLKEEEEGENLAFSRPFSAGSLPLMLTTAATPLYADEKGTTLAYSRLGAGGILICASPWAASNEGLGRSQNIEVILSALHAFAPQKERVILFDEYHHGYAEGKSLLSLLPGLAKVGLLQVGLAMGILLFSLGRRFGAPVAPRADRRVRGEYLSAMSLLLRRAGATDLALDRLRDQFRKDLARATRLSPGVGEEEVAEAVERVRGVPKEKVRKVFSLCDRLRNDYRRHFKGGDRHFVSIGEKERETRLLALTTEMREVVLECQRKR